MRRGRDHEYTPVDLEEDEVRYEKPRNWFPKTTERKRWALWKVVLLIEVLNIVALATVIGAWRVGRKWKNYYHGKQFSHEYESTHPIPPSVNLLPLSLTITSSPPTAIPPQLNLHLHSKQNGPPPRPKHKRSKLLLAKHNPRPPQRSHLPPPLPHNPPRPPRLQPRHRPRRVRFPSRHVPPTALSRTHPF